MPWKIKKSKTLVPRIRIYWKQRLIVNRTASIFFSFSLSLPLPLPLFLLLLSPPPTLFYFSFTHFTKHKISIVLHVTSAVFILCKWKFWFIFWMMPKSRSRRRKKKKKKTTNKIIFALNFFFSLGFPGGGEAKESDCRA